MTTLIQPDERTVEALREIAFRFGTPTYAFDIRRLQAQVKLLHDQLSTDVEILYSLKANASLGICDVFAQSGIGADVASAGELATAIAAGFPDDRIFVAGPFKHRETIEMLREHPKAIVSVDSMSEFEMLEQAGIENPLVIRLRPDFGSCAVVKAGSESRFGFTCEAIEQCRQAIPTSSMNVIGFHVFAGSQVLDTDRLTEHLDRAMELSLRSAETLNITPTYINLGGGFGIPYGVTEPRIDLDRIGDRMAKYIEMAKPAKMVLELGRFLVAEAGWYLNAVMGHQAFQGRPAVIVDGGVHQRADMCGLCLRTNQQPPLVVNRDATNLVPTDVLGCLSLPDDIMLQDTPLPADLGEGDVIAFAHAGAYGMWSSPSIFHGSPLPAEVCFDDHDLYLMRERKPSTSILDDQQHVRISASPSTASQPQDAAKI